MKAKVSVRGDHDLSSFFNFSKTNKIPKIQFDGLTRLLPYLSVTHLDDLTCTQSSIPLGAGGQERGHDTNQPRLPSA